MKRTPSGPAVLLALGLAGIVGLWIGAQYLAWRFAFHPNLGTPAIELAGMRLYTPLRYAVWLAAYHRIPSVNAVLRESLLASGAGTFLTYVGATVLLRRRSQSPGSSHGTARWGEARSLLSDSDGLIVAQEGRRLLRYAARGEPLLTFAPTGAG